MQELKALLESLGLWEDFKFNLTNYPKHPLPFKIDQHNHPIVEAFAWHQGRSSWTTWLDVHRKWCKLQGVQP